MLVSYSVYVFSSYGVAAVVLIILATRSLSAYLRFKQLETNRRSGAGH